MIDRLCRTTVRLCAISLMVCLGTGLSWSQRGPLASAQTKGSVLSTGSYQLFEQPDAHLSPVLHLIRSARRSLRLELYLLTESSIVNELQRARVRVQKR